MKSLMIQPIGNAGAIWVQGVIGICGNPCKERYPIDSPQAYVKYLKN